MAKTNSIQSSANGPEEGLSPLRYGVNFAKTVMKDNKFWSRFGAMPNGIKLMMQAVMGGFFLLSAPLAVQVLGFAGCCALGTAGLGALMLGAPGAWQRMEDNFAQTFPRFNPLKSLRQPFRARRRKQIPTVPQDKVQKAPSSRLKERHLDLFLSSVTLEGCAFGLVAWPLLAAPIVTALPAITVAGGVMLAGAATGTVTSICGITYATKTLAQTLRQSTRNKNATAVPPQQTEKTKPLPSAVTSTFNTLPAHSPKTAAAAAARDNKNTGRKPIL